MAKEKDALEAIIDQIKKIQERIDSIGSGDTSSLQEQIDMLNEKLNKKPDFGDWD